jgi:hypothetical protein
MNLLKKRISSHVELAITSHTVTWVHPKLVTVRLARQLTACALFARRLPVLALRSSAVSHPGATPALNDKQLFIEEVDDSGVDRRETRRAEPPAILEDVPPNEAKADLVVALGPGVQFGVPPVGSIFGENPIEGAERADWLLVVRQAAAAPGVERGQ